MGGTPSSQQQPKDTAAKPDKERQALKDLYLGKRKLFRDDKDLLEELQAWKKHETKKEYKHL